MLNKNNKRMVIFPTTTYIIILIHDGKEDVRVSAFFPEINDKVKELIRQYGIKEILINGLSKISNKVFEKLSVDKDIHCPINMVGGY